MSKKTSAYSKLKEGKSQHPPKKPEPGLLQIPRNPNRWRLIVLFLVITIGGSWLALSRGGFGGVPRYTYKLINKYPHDETLFTQGLIIDSERNVVESSGQYGSSAVTKSRLESGEQIRQKKLDKKYFGEGLAQIGDRLFQLTWKEETALVYDLEFNELEKKTYDGEGWGLATNGAQLIMSNGTHRLAFLDPDSLQIERVIWVRMGRRSISQLNELEYAGGKIYANQLNSDWIYEINSETGAVEAMIDLSGLWPDRERPTNGILNGIAFDSQSRHIFVTGKYCPWLYEVEFVPK